MILVDPPRIVEIGCTQTLFVPIHQFFDQSFTAIFSFDLCTKKLTWTEIVILSYNHLRGFCMTERSRLQSQNTVDHLQHLLLQN